MKSVRLHYFHFHLIVSRSSVLLSKRSSSEGGKNRFVFNTFFGCSLLGTVSTLPYCTGTPFSLLFSLSEMNRFYLILIFEQTRGPQ